MIHVARELTTMWNHGPRAKPWYDPSRTPLSINAQTSTVAHHQGIQRLSMPCWLRAQLLSLGLKARSFVDMERSPSPQRRPHP